MKQKVKSGIFIVSDIILLTASFFLAYLIRHDFVFDAIMKEFVQKMPLILAISITL